MGGFFKVSYGSKLLEHTTVKLYGNTLVIYTPKLLIRDKRDNQHILEIIIDNIEPELGITATKIEILFSEDFYPSHHTADVTGIGKSVIPS